MAGGVSFDKAVMDAAANLLDEKTDAQLQKIFDEIKDRIDIEIGQEGTKWSGTQAANFHDDFINDQVPEIEKALKNIHNIADNIREQANGWAQFDEQ